ncbi:MAG: transposase family protein [Clostridium sp.]
MITFFAMLANANEWVEIEIFAKAKEKWLRKYLELPYGIPAAQICFHIAERCRSSFRTRPLLWIRV